MKTETQNTNALDMQKETMNYLNNSSKHLFLVRTMWESEFGETMYKVFPITVQEKLMYITIVFTKDKIDIAIKDVSYINTKNQLGMFKNEVFPQYKKHKSIKTFKDFSMKFEKIYKFIEDSNLDAQNIKIGIEKIMRDDNE